MAIQTQDQLIAQALGQMSQGGAQPPGMPGMPGAPGAPMAPGFPQPTGMPGAPAVDPQAIAQMLGAAPSGIDPTMMAAGSADQLPGAGSFSDYLMQMRNWKTCQMQGGMNCGPQPQQGVPAPQPAPVGV